jgi:vacuolar-type H+-ATPase subunit H
VTEKDILSKVIGVEKEIQERLMAEKERSLEWLEKVKKEAEEAVIAEERRLKESFEAAKSGSRAEAEKRAAEILRNAEAEAERISGISDESLGRIMMRHITVILPLDTPPEKPERSAGSGV